MHCDLLKKVTGHEAMFQGLRETACKYEINILQILNTHGSTGKGNMVNMILRILAQLLTSSTWAVQNMAYRLSPAARWNMPITRDRSHTRSRIVPLTEKIAKHIPPQRRHFPVLASI